MSQSQPEEIHLYLNDGEEDSRPVAEEKNLMRCLLGITGLILVGTATAILVSYLLY